MKDNLSLLSILLFCFSLGVFPLQAQKDKAFSLEISSSIGYSDFLLAPNPRDVVWNMPGDNKGFSVTTRTKIGLAWQVGLGVAKPINDRIHLRMRISLHQGKFSHLMEGLVFASDILNPIDGEIKSSTFRSDIRFTNLTIPIMGDFYWSSKASPFFSTIGLGAATTLKTTGSTILIYSDGNLGTPTPNPYQAEKWKGFIVLGIGKKIPLGTANRFITIGGQLNYFLTEEAFNVFESAGRLMQPQLQLAFRL